MSLLRKVALPIVMVSTTLFAACTTPNTLLTQVNAFHNWSADTQGKRYAFSTDFSKNLEQKSYADLIAKEMRHTGLIQTDNTQKADYLVNFHTRTEVHEKIEQTYYVEPIIVPVFGFGYFGYDWWNPSMYSAFDIDYIPQSVQYPVQYYRHLLAIEIQNKTTGNPVYQAEAIALTRHASLTQTMPYLAASAFDRFPGSNGGTRYVEFDMDKSQEQQTPVKYTPQ